MFFYSDSILVSIIIKKSSMSDFVSVNFIILFSDDEIIMDDNLNFQIMEDNMLNSLDIEELENQIYEISISACSPCNIDKIISQMEIEENIAFYDTNYLLEL